MKFELRAGAELDLVTPEELRGELERVRRLQLELEPTHERGRAQQTSDANGEATIELYRVPHGYTLSLHRVVVQADGYTTATPWTATDDASLEVLVERGGEVVAWAATPAIPSMPVDDGYHQAARFRNGERVVVHVVHGPTATRLYAAFSGFLRKGAP